jgi:hypothetical protein
LNIFLGDPEVARENTMAPIYEPKAKRRKLDVTESAPKFTVMSVRDLDDLLHFKQSSSPDVKNGNTPMLHGYVSADVFRYPKSQGFPH